MAKKALVLLTVAALALLTASTVWADSVPISNANFETVDPSNPLIISCGLPGCSYNVGSIPGWSVSEGGSWQPGPNVFASDPDGGSKGGYTNHGSISQTLTETVLPNTTYTLTVFVGNRGGGLNGLYSLSLETVLGAVFTPLCSTPTSLASALNANDIPVGTYQAEGCTFTSGSTVPSGDLYLLFNSLGGQLDVDDASLTFQQHSTNVPEPSSVLLLAFGVLAIAAAGLLSKQREAALNA